MTDHTKCAMCKLHKHRTNVVWGEGCVPNRVMVIGDAPGSEEDIRGVPFVGAAGRLLTNMLASIGLERPINVYLTTMVKCRGLHDRKPEQDEIDACHETLMGQIINCDPDVIIVLGEVALRGLLKIDEPVSNVRGKWCSLQTPIKLVKCIVMYHPAYLLRNQSRDEGAPKWQTWQDLKMVRAYLDSVE